MLATIGGYKTLCSLGEGLDTVRRAVEDSPNAANQSKLRKLGVDRFHLPVAAVLLLLVVESLVGTRRKLRQNMN